MEELYYLINRPVSHNSEIVDAFVTDVAKATGLTAMTVKQKLQGTAFEVFQTSRDKVQIDKYHTVLKSFNIPSFIIPKSKVKTSGEPISCKAIKSDGDSVVLLDGQGREIVTLDDSMSGLMVLGAINIDRVKSKRINKMAIAKSAVFSPMEIINLIMMNSPVMDLCLPGTKDEPAKIIRIDSRRFTFNSLGKDRAYSSAENFRVIMGKVQGALKSSMVDTGFGENSLPFLSLHYEGKEDNVLLDFTIYSRVAFLAARYKLFNKVTVKEGLVSDSPVLADLGGALWASPLLLSLPNNIGNIKNFLTGAGSGQTGGDQTVSDRGNTSVKDESIEKHFANKTENLPAPPVSAMTFSSGWSINDMRNYISITTRVLRQMGPPLLFFPLVGLSVLFTGVAYMGSMIEPLTISALSMGVVLFVHAFVLLKRKRTIENHPTAKIGTMPMGEVEIMGRARQKYYLKSPYSMLDCIYYSYKVYTYETDNRGNRRKILKSGGESGPVPFYLEDESGRVVINPKGAVIKGGITETHSGSSFTSFAMGGSAYGAGEKEVIETVIPAGMSVFVLGYGKRVIEDRKSSAREFLERLRAFKSDKDKMSSFDTDSDGKMSVTEWEEVKAHVRDEILKEKLENAGKSANIQVSEHPSGGMFYITDSHEEGILKSLTWRVPFMFCVGFSGLVVGFLYLPRFIILRKLLLARLFEW